MTDRRYIAGLWMGRLVSVVPTVLLVAAIVAYLSALANRFFFYMPGIAQSAVKSILHRELRLGQITHSPTYDQITLTDVALSNGPTFQADNGRVAMSAPEVVVHINAAALIHDPSQAASYVESIDLEKPYFFAERQSGSNFNFSSIFKIKTNPKNKPFQARINFHSGTLDYLDHTASRALQPAINHLIDVNGFLDFGAPHAVAFDLTGLSGDNRFGLTRVTGSAVSIQTKDPAVYKIGSYTAHIDTQNADYAYLGRYFLGNLASKTLIIQGGRGTGSVTLSQVNPAPGVPLDIAGTARVTGGSLMVTARNTANKSLIIAKPISNVAGDVSFTNSAVAFDATGSADGIPVTVRGATQTKAAGSIALHVESNAVNVAALHSVIPSVPVIPSWLKSTAPVSAKVSVIGTTTSPVINVAFVEPSGIVQGVPVTDISGGAQIRGTTVTIPSLIASMSGQRDNIRVAASFDTKSGRLLAAAGTVRGADLAALPLTQAQHRQFGSLDGRLDANVRMLAPSKAGGNPQIVFDANVGNGHIHGLKVADASVSGSTDGQSLKLSHFTLVASRGGLLVARGSLPLSSKSLTPFDLNVNAAGVDLDALGPAFGQTQIAGYGSFRGSVTGSLTNPLVAGRLRVLEPQYEKWQFDQFRSNLTYRANTVHLADAQISKIGVDVAVDATISHLDRPQPTIAATADLPSSDIASLDAVVDEFNGGEKENPTQFKQIADTASGDISAKATVSGPLKNPSISFTASSDTAEIDGLDIDHAELAGALVGNRIDIRSLAAEVGGAAFASSGWIGLKSQTLSMTGTMSSSDLTTTALAKYIDKPFTGAAVVTASVSGRLSDPSATAEIKGKTLSYNSTAIGNIDTKLSYVKGVVKTTAPVDTSVGSAQITLASISYDINRKMIDANASLGSETIQQLIALVNADIPQASDTLAKLPPGINGDLSIKSLSVAGQISKPVISVDGGVTNLILDSNSDDALKVALQFSTYNGAVTVKQLEARGTQAYLTLTGSMVPHGPFDANFEASNIPMRLLAPFATPGVNLGGQIDDLTVIASGTSADPQIVASLSAANLAYKKFEIDRIDTGKVELAEGKLTIAGVTVEKNGLKDDPTAIHLLTLKGTVPLSLSLENGIHASLSSTKPVSLQLSLPTQSAEVVGLFAATPLPAAIKGNVSGGLNLSGTLAHKVVDGNVTLTDYSVTPQGFHTTFSGKQLGVTFNDVSGTIAATQIQSSAGGYATVSGTISTSAPLGAQGDLSSTLQAISSNVAIKLHLAATGMTISEPRIVELYDAGFQGKIDGALDMNGPVLHPTISGALNISKAVGTLPSVSPNASPSTGPPAFDPSFNIKVAFLPGAVMKSPQLNTTADGSFDIAGDLASPNVQGQIYLRRGTFKFPTATFRIQPVGIVNIVYNPPDQISERINLTATTSISVSPSLLAANVNAASGLYGTGFSPGMLQPAASQAQNSTPQRYDVTVDITGDLNVPNGLHLSFTTNPGGLPERVILAALGGQAALDSLLVNGNVQGALQDEAQAIFTGFAVPSLLEPVESNIASSLGLQDFSIDYLPNAPLLVSVVKSLGHKFDIKYTRYLMSHTEAGAVGSTLTPLAYTASLDYNFTNRFHLSLSTDDQHDNGVSIGGTFGF